MTTGRWLYISAIGLLGARAVGCSGSSGSGTTDEGPHGLSDGGGAGASGTGGSDASAGSTSAGAPASNAGMGGASASGGRSNAPGGRASSGGVAGATAGSSSASGGSMEGADAAAGSANGTAPGVACDRIQSLAEAYKVAHPGNGGKDWDINAKSSAQLAADPEAQRLLSICGKDERPVIPLLAWEYGGGDHSWINPQASAVAYCVAVPVHPDSAHWQYDAMADHVTADVSVPCPDQNPCRTKTGADQVMACLGDSTNIEVLVDTASLDDGAGAGLSLANASTDLNFVGADGSRVHMYTGL
jgi:hypothetical protein